MCILNKYKSRKLYGKLSILIGFEKKMFLRITRLFYVFFSLFH